jgi:hypothetical protein
MPWLIADTVCGEVARFLGLPEDFNLGHRLPPGQHPLIRLKTEDCGRWLKARARHGPPFK